MLLYLFIVNNLAKSMKFYQDGFGWQTQGIVGTEFEHGAVVFFNLDNGLIISLYERKNLAWDSGLEQQPERAGAKIIKPAQKTFWGGYAGYFKDIDGHLWEIAYNPALTVDE